MRKVEQAYSKGYRVLEDGVLIGPRGPRKTQLNNDGYRYFSFRDFDNKYAYCTVHRLAAYQWFGDELFKDGIEVRHLDSNRQNCARPNLALGTKVENNADKAPEVRQAIADAGGRALRSLSEEQVRQLRADRVAGANYDTLMARYGIARGTVSYIVNGKTYKKVG